MRALAIAALLAALAGHAHADDQRERAEVYFRAGEQAYRAQNFAAAARNFEEAYAMLPLPEIAFSAAQAYRRQYRIDGNPEHVARAIDLYRKYLAKVQTGGRVADAADALAEMQRELDLLIRSGKQVKPELAAEHTQLGVYVALGTAPATGGALREVEDQGPAVASEVRVTIDGERRDAFALVNVTPGDHAIHVEAPGFFPVDKHAIAVQGASTMVDVALAPRPGRIHVTTDAGARVQVDGRTVGTGPSASVDVPAGRHLVTIVQRGREPVAQELVVENAKEVPLTAPLEPTAKRRAVPWVLRGAGVLAVGAGITATVALLAQHEALDISHHANGSGNLDPRQMQTYNDDLGRRDDFRTATWILGAAAVTTAAVGFVLYRFDEPPPETPRVTPVLGPHGGGAAVVGRF